MESSTILGIFNEMKAAVSKTTFAVWSTSTWKLINFCALFVCHLCLLVHVSAYATIDPFPLSHRHTHTFIHLVAIFTKAHIPSKPRTLVFASTGKDCVSSQIVFSRNVRHPQTYPLLNHPPHLARTQTHLYSKHVLSD